MKISNNTKKIIRNKKISQLVLYLSLAILIIGLIWSLTSSTNISIQFSYFVLIPAYFLVQISIYLANRWGRSPRPDEILVNALKGLPDQYTLYNYNVGVPHLLVGPAGLWIIKPYYHSGEISYDTIKGKYRQKGGPFIISKLFAQESLPDLEHESKQLMRLFTNFINKEDIKIGVEPNVVNIFYSEKAEVLANKAPEPTMNAEKLKNFIRGKAKQNPLADVKIKEITDQLPKPD